MKNWKLLAITGVAAVCAPLMAASQSGSPVVDNSRAPTVAFDTEEFGVLPDGRNFGEILGVAVNSKGNVVILNHPGSATTGPLYGNATTEIFEFGGVSATLGRVEALSSIRIFARFGWTSGLLE